MFESLVEGFYLLIGVFLVLTLLTNLSPKIPRFPWDIFLDRFGFSVYVPITSALIITILISILLNLTRT